MPSINQAVIFAGGKGIRLQPITDSIPKPLVRVCGIPFLDYLFLSIVDVGIQNILTSILAYNEQYRFIY